MWIVFVISSLVFFILGWFLRNKNAHWLISGFSMKTKEEQERLLQIGYPKKVGGLMYVLAGSMIVTIPLQLLSVPFAIEISFGIMIVMLFVGTLYLGSFESARNRKRYYWIISITFLLVIGFIVGLYITGQGFEMVLKEDSFEITGMYGVAWSYNEVKKVELLSEMPEVTYKTNGFGTSTIAHGHFKVKDYGESLLYIRKGSSPYLYIEVGDQKIFMNSTNPEETNQWYERLSSFGK